ncbi:DUF1636 family protein [Roseivivax sediminis]|uniref:Predicted metal-binding protein n=1 Tax=Roseivivax sediminis TaxID=936889 RepID=A0A1I1U064_9RHOB|nr:DUF1636 domain-containing protein [Roseivivax sediminis]SFD64129.1 Predicted metal-binding protein [Roseivivax sediminis]
MNASPAEAELLVCVKCRRGQDMPDDARRPGTHLFEALAARPAPEGVTITPVECLQNCDDGCTVALRGPGRWTYVYGRLHEAEHVDTLLDGAERYRDTADGLIPWRQRPEHFKRNCIARVPPPTSQEEPKNG